MRGSLENTTQGNRKRADANTENPSVKVTFVWKALTIAIEINNAVAITTIHPVARFCVMYTDAQTAKYAVSNRADFKDNVGMLFEPECRRAASQVAQSFD